ncbi:ubinuclein-1-like isoform X1 [Punica granatum]|uniref:Ubinuclein-1-like isoform X1 n=1 Tax=Punica granatum TaxID=22663 RepID=A0A6P8D8N0_PUNGR|nr:ubinuclein-1-like isoform X1 [Punica granatum]
MEEDEKTAAGGADSSPRVTPSYVKSGDRQVFTVELRPGDTTIVSWKKLLKDANKVRNGSSASASAAGPSSSAAAQAALEPRPLPGHVMENEANDAAAPNRFSAVIEKIERLYMGKDSSDEEDLNDVPDDDQYDTEDSFIDDAELDEYFEVDNAAVKHDGFFVNRGKLECINEPTAPPSQQAKKRRRRDVMKGSGEKDDGILPNKHIKVGKTSSGKDAALVGSNSSYLSQSLTMMRQPHEDAKASNQFNLSGSGVKKKSADNTRDMEKQKTGAPSSKSIHSKLKDPSGSSDVLHHKYHDRSSFTSSKSQAGRTAEEYEKLNRREKHGVREVPDLNIPDSRHMETSVDSGSTILQKTAQHIPRKDGASGRPKISLLEKAIRDLEKMVAESRPPVAENTETDISSQAVKRRLPTDIKLKLARVAKLASSHGKISKELINRLNGIVGHLVQLRTLKRNLKMMVNTSLSAKQEKENRFQQIKKEVADMVRVRVLSLDSKAGSSDDFQELGPNVKGLTPTKYDMDPAVEDKICDLYDLYIDGLDEETGPQIRKLYSELAQLWPNGFMDNHGIKSAICRSKERKRVVLNNRHKDQVRIRRKKLLTPKTEPSTVRAESGSIAQSQHTSQPHHSLDRLAVEPSTHTSTSANKQVPGTSAIRAPSPRNGSSSDRVVKQEKAKGNSSSPVDDPRVAEGAQLQKKVKRKPEVDLNEMPYPVEKLPSQHGDDRLNPNPLKPSGGLPQKSSLKQNSAASFEQSS